MGGSCKGNYGMLARGCVQATLSMGGSCKAKKWHWVKPRVQATLSRGGSWKGVTVETFRTLG